MADSESKDEPRKPGRPRAEQPRANISAWVLADTYVRVIRRANARNVSVSKYVSDVLEKVVTPRDCKK